MMKKYRDIIVWVLIGIRILAEFVWIYFIYKETGMMTSLFILIFTIDMELKKITKTLERKAEQLRNEILEQLISKNENAL